MKLYCDMDGVLVDFNLAAMKLMNEAMQNPEKHEHRECFHALKERLKELGRDHVEVADLEKAIYRGLASDEVIPAARELMKQLIAEGGAEWWANLSWHPTGKKLWEGIKDLNPTILTAPMSEAPGCAEGKIEWVRKNLGLTTERMILEDEKYKFAFVAHEPNVLIDDFTCNTIPWAEHGGIPLLYTSSNVDEIVEKLNRWFG